MTLLIKYLREKIFFSLFINKKKKLKWTVLEEATKKTQNNLI